LPPWSATPDGLSLAIRLTPRGGRDALDGVETLADGSEVLKARVRAAPSEGEANAALVELLAKLLAVPRSQVRLTAGASARLKRVAVHGDPATLLERLRARLAGS
jgi:uncharacterized protein YggU (UPF0235/DUF167 family)